MALLNIYQVFYGKTTLVEDRIYVSTIKEDVGDFIKEEIIKDLVNDTDFSIDELEETQDERYVFLKNMSSIDVFENVLNDDEDFFGYFNNFTIDVIPIPINEIKQLLKK